MNSADESILGLFPLDLVLVPGEVVLLHVFEDRYRLLIAECLDGGEFGVVLSEDDTIHECGCSARVVELVERLDDGSMNVLIKGDRRFRIMEMRELDDPESEYPSALVKYYGDKRSDAPEELRSGVLDVYRRMLILMDAESTGDPAGEGPLSFRIAAAVDFGAALKQDLLESLSEESRLQTLLTVMEALLPRLRLRKEREEAIRGNGKGY